MTSVSPEPVLVIGGMHRSGTSLTASLLQGAGLFIGARLMGPYKGNEKGHFEDLDFYDFHKKALAANGLQEDGFISLGGPRVPTDLEHVAMELVAERRARRIPWGWKDPRTTLFLDFWRRLLPEARFLFVFRSPWAVMDSLVRRGDVSIRENISLAIRSWLVFNRAILDFVGRHPEACLVRGVAQIAAAPGRLCGDLRNRLGIPLGDPPDVYDPRLLATIAPPRHPPSALDEECRQVYQQLEHVAGCNEGQPLHVPAAVAGGVRRGSGPTAARPVLFVGHTDPGFFIHTLGMLSAGLDDAVPVPTCRPFLESLAAVQGGGHPFSLLVPLMNGMLDAEQRAVVLAALAAVASDVDGGRCRVFFDFCNEAGHPHIVGPLVDLAAEAGIRRLGNLTIICQNRKLARVDLPIRHACFDAFLVAGWKACRELLLTEGLPLDGVRASRAFPAPRHDILCLNATPRFHRLVTLLMLADAGIIDLDAPDHAPHCQIPFVSYPGLVYDKLERWDPVLVEDVERRMIAEGHEKLLIHLPRLLARTPLRVDAFPATGNALAFAIDLRHYRDTKISVVTETSLGADVQRITEKTLKPLALGQPCITIGHPHSLAVAQALGYDTFDDCLDNRYDSIEDERGLMEAAVASVRGFLSRYDSDQALRERVRSAGLRNMRWTLDGFQRHYYETCGRPLLTALLDPVHGATINR